MSGSTPFSWAFLHFILFYGCLSCAWSSFSLPDSALFMVYDKFMN